jgi:hypothetical protein
MSRLKKGPRANVMIGKEGERYIALEGASVKLLATFPPTANEVFRKDLGKAIPELLDARVKNSDKYYRTTKNPHVIWAIRYRENVLSGVPPPKFKNSATQSIKSNKQTEGAAPSLFHKTESPAKDSTDTLQATEGAQGISSGVAQQQNLKAKKPFTCHKCGGEGHMARNC